MGLNLASLLAETAARVPENPAVRLGEAELTATLELLTPLLTEDAVVIVERAARSERPTLPAGLTHGRSKRYGDTALWWVHPA